MTTEDDPETPIPRTVELLWQAQEPPRRGPKPALSVDQVVDTAIQIADAEGLAALSMRKVAEQLGFTTMSLYRHVPGKEHLLDLMAERALDPPPTSPDEVGGAGPSRGELESWARYLWAGYHRHPWLLDLPVTGPPVGPNGLAWLDTGLHAIARIGLTGGPAVGGVMTLLAYVRGQAQLALSMTAATPATGISYDEWGAVYGRVLERFVTAERYPMLAEVAATGVFAGPPHAGSDEVDEDFEFGLQRVLDGLEAHATGYG